MTHRIPNKIQPAHWLGSLVLLSIFGAFIKLAFAITAFSPQSQPTGYVGQQTFTNGTVTSGNETVYRVEFEKGYWSGNLYAYPIDANGAVSTSAERWSGGAAVHLAVQNFSTGRYIGTMKDDGTKVPFLSSSLSAAQQGTLAATVNALAFNSTQIVDFLRGDHSNESPVKLRERLTPQGNSTTLTVLGDIIHSKPLYLSDANYPTVLIGANDGMLHAINSNDGSERWAYVPSMLLSKMKSLAANPYTHDYYVDGPVTVGNATLSGVSKRILVGALGAGGKGLYALNIDGSAGLTAASNQDAANKVIWEITPTKVNYATPQNNDASTNATAYSNLGYTYGTPAIKTINIGGTPLQVVIVGNGYNNGGDNQAYLYIINAENGRLVRAIKADNTCTGCSGVTNGTATSPNGLFSTLGIDTDADGYVDRVYAGSLNGTLFKFDLSSTTPASWTANALHNTSPAQPITATVAALDHPTGVGYMVNFATGSVFTGTQPTTGTGATGDLGDTSTFYVYGIWDSNGTSGNTTLAQPVLSERCYNKSGTPSVLPCSSTETRVRRVTATPPNWAAGGDKGWKIALPIGGERVVGEGSFISSGRFYFSTYNPTISYLVPNTTTYIWGENWQMGLDSATGSSADLYIDMDGNGTITNNDRIKYNSADAEVIAGTQTVNTPILLPSVDGIEVGKWSSRGVQSQPSFVKTTSLLALLTSTNPDATTTPVVVVGTGVSGGHFDEDIYYGNIVTASAKATATITVGSTGDTQPATLGGITIDGVTIVPALTVSDITNGSATATNATTIKNKVTGGIYTATVSGSTITLTAPAGASYNGKTITIIPGTSSGNAGTVAVRPTGLITFSGIKTSNSTNAILSKTLSGNTASVVVGSYKYSNTITVGKNKTPSDAASKFVSDIGTGGSVKAYLGGNSITPTCAAQPVNVVCLVDTSTYNNSTAVQTGAWNDSGVTFTTTATAGGQAAVAPTGYRDLAPALTTTSFSGGADGGVSGDTCTSCVSKQHIHQYDDKFDVTGVNMLNASDALLNLEKAIPGTSQNFKVIMHNQYLNPAVMIHFGDANYLPKVNFGYISVKNFTTSSTLALATLPTYNRSNVGSLVINMPVDALTAKDWWGNGDVRVGLHPTATGCVKKSAGLTDGNMYQPIEAPANINNTTLPYPPDGPGVLGYSNATTPATATGVRHGGALTIQIIRDNTPDSAIELNDHLSRPEYGWRVKSSDYSTYVLAEYTTFWHHPSGKCFGSTGWTKTPAPDLSSSTLQTAAAGSTDPKLGDLSGSTSNSATLTTGSTTCGTAGSTKTYTNADGSKLVVTTIARSDGSIVTITTSYPVGVTTTICHVVNTDGTVTSTSSDTSSGIVANGGTITLGAGVKVTMDTTAKKEGSILELGLYDQNKTGYKRISWKELFND